MIYLLPALLAGTLLVAISSVKTTVSARIDAPLLLPPSQIKYFTLGYDEVVADGFWLRTIQDFDFCENKRPSDKGQIVCQKGWVFHMIDAITELAPRFERAYRSGAIMLTVIVNDIDGASRIFDKGMKQFPNDGQLAYAAAYQALFEEKNSDKAARLLVIAGKNGLPPWVFALAGRLQQKSGQLELARSILQEAVDLDPSGPGAERIQQRLTEVEKALAKTKPGN